MSVGIVEMCITGYLMELWVTLLQEVDGSVYFLSILLYSSFPKFHLEYCWNYRILIDRTIQKIQF